MEERKLMNHKEPLIIEHLASISVKHNVYLSELYRSLVSARITGKSTCKDLKIEYRGLINERGVFLIKRGNNVIVQFQVAEDFLLRKDINFESWLDTDKIRRQVTRQNLGFNLTSIQSLRHGMKKISLKAEVLETKEPKTVNTQFGSRVKVTDVWIADETGKVKLCIWGEQANFPVEGDTLQIKGASVQAFRGEKLLTLGRCGSLSILHPLLVETVKTSHVCT